MNRRLGTGVGVAAVVLAVLLWRCHGSHETATTTGSAGSARAVATHATAAAKPRPDPKAIARGSIAGTVTDEATRAPIAHAHVCVGGDSNELPEELLREPFCTETDARGAFVVGNLLPAEYSTSASAKTYRPAVHHPGGDHKRTSFRLAAGEHKTGIDLALRAGGVEVTGVVSDLTGGPIGKAHVWADAGGWRSRGALVATETDDQGAFSLWVAPGELALTATADGYADGYETIHAPGKAELLLTPESSVAGTVVDATSGQPVEGARVMVGPTEWAWDGGATTFTDAQGTFRLTRLTPGRVVAVARTEHGYGRTEGSTLVGLGQHVEGVVVKLFGARHVAGTVVIAGTKTTCEQPSVSLREDTADRWISLVRQEDGSVAADGVLPGTYSVSVGCAGYQSRDTYAPIKLADKDATGLVWEVEAGSAIVGKVVTKAGEPVEGAEVWASTIGGAARAKGGWGGDTTQRDGHYELVGLKPGSYRIGVSSDHGIGPKDGFKVDVAAGAKVEKDLVLDDAGAIKGSVVDASGKPVAGVRISARSTTGMWGWGDNNTSDEAGNFTIEGLRPGDYRVTAQRTWNDQLRKPGTTDDSKQGEKVTVRPNATASVKLVVESQTGSIKGVVIDSGGKPVPDAFVSAARESDAAGSQQTSVAETRWEWDDKPVITSVDGTFTVAQLSPGMYTVRAYRKGGGEAVAEHVALQTSAKLQIKPTGSIEGTARRAAGPPDEVTIAVSDRVTGFDRIEKFYMTGGHFLVRDLPEGHFQIAVTAAGARQQRELDLAEGEAKTGVDVTLEDLVTLTGRLVDYLTKQPVPGMQMFATDATNDGSFSFGGDDQANISDEAGAFTLKNAPRGKVILRGFPKDRDGDYARLSVVRTVEGTGTVALGDIGVLKRRVKPGDPVGELGINFKEQPPTTLPDQRTFEVSSIDPAGPAAKTELKVGDVITSIDCVRHHGREQRQCLHLAAGTAGHQARARPGARRDRQRRPGDALGRAQHASVRGREPRREQVRIHARRHELGVGELGRLEHRDPRLTLAPEQPPLARGRVADRPRARAVERHRALELDHVARELGLGDQQHALGDPPQPPLGIDQPHRAVDPASHVDERRGDLERLRGDAVIDVARAGADREPRPVAARHERARLRAGGTGDRRRRHPRRAVEAKDRAAGTEHVDVRAVDRERPDRRDAGAELGPGRPVEVPQPAARAVDGPHVRGAGDLELAHAGARAEHLGPARPARAVVGEEPPICRGDRDRARRGEHVRVAERARGRCGGRRPARAVPVNDRPALPDRGDIARGRRLHADERLVDAGVVTLEPHPVEHARASVGADQPHVVDARRRDVADPAVGAEQIVVGPPQPTVEVAHRARERVRDPRLLGRRRDRARPTLRIEPAVAERIAHEVRAPHGVIRGARQRRIRELCHLREHPAVRRGVGPALGVRDDAAARLRARVVDVRQPRVDEPGAVEPPQRALVVEDPRLAFDPHEQLARGRRRRDHVPGRIDRAMRELPRGIDRPDVRGARCDRDEPQRARRIRGARRHHAAIRIARDLARRARGDEVITGERRGEHAPDDRQRRLQPRRAVVVEDPRLARAAPVAEQPDV